MSESSSIAADGYSLQLTRETSIMEENAVPYAWRMRISVTDSAGLDTNIFLHRRAGGKDDFLCICSPVDLVEYPVGEPEAGKLPFFRAAVVDLLSRSSDMLEEGWLMIVQDCRRLVKAMATLDRLEEDTVIDIEYAP